ncbi:MAG: glycoside hydrolase family 3 protein [Salinivirgaceae bacterium]|jgi:beta-N-acetylhexosaminidase|nr:glycoside hydrolase family 3 protein [Salinivirgaceae bacterium]
MKRIRSCKRHFIVLITITLLASCNNSKSELKVSQTIKTDSAWTKLSLREKIGQVVCLNFSQQQILNYKDGTVEQFLKDYPVGALFLASWNLSGMTSQDSLEHLYRSLVTEFSNSSKTPLLFVEDFETGIGTSISKYTPLTAEMGLGAANSPELNRIFGNILASEARSIGINWLLHPVADLNMNPFNHITNIRSIADDAELAIKLLPHQIKAMQGLGVAATAKHFPGDGTDVINQHFKTSTYQLTYDDWFQQHGKVFKTLIDSGVMCIMPGHISFPAYQQELLNDEYLPATLSKELMTNLLKGDMGFKGVIVSDALEMAGIANYYENQLETEIECFKAGADVLLWPGLDFIDTLEARILRREIPIERLNDAVSRVWNLKKQLGLFDAHYKHIIPLSNEQLAEHRKQAYEIAKKSLTLISDKGKILPINAKTDKNLLVVLVSEVDHVKTFNPLLSALKTQGFNVDFHNSMSFFTNGHEIPKVIEDYDKILFVFYSSPGNPWGTLSLNTDEAGTMWLANKLPFEKVLSIGFGDPYKNLIYMSRTWCRINCYNADINSQKALVELLIGNGSFEGVSPVNYFGLN